MELNKSLPSISPLSNSSCGLNSSSSCSSSCSSSSSSLSSSTSLLRMKKQGKSFSQAEVCYFLFIILSFDYYSIIL